jgi:dolichol-phosphate mannosyltransferase
MLSAAMNPSCLLVDDAATRARLDAGTAECAPFKFALVIPTLREGENLLPLLDRIRAALDPFEPSYEILVVDDDSCDGTAELVSGLALRDPRVRLLERKGQRGLSGAVLHGWRHTDAPILGVMDADLQHPPELLPELISSVMTGCDLAIGSRYTAGGAMEKWNPARRLLSAAAIWVTWPLQRAGLRARDPMSGFFFVRRDCVDRIAFMPCGFKLLLEILVRARVRSVAEIPFAFGIRYRGSSKVSLRVACDYARLLARLYRIRCIGKLLPGSAADPDAALLRLFDEPEPSKLTHQPAAEFQEEPSDAL